MKVLFLARHFGYLRNFEPVIAALAARGHVLHLAADRPEASGGQQMVERLASSSPSITWGWTPKRDADPWLGLATRLRLGLDNLRYYDPIYDESPRLRARVDERTPYAVMRALRVPGLAAPTSRAMAGALLRRLERAVPVDPALVAYLRGIAPDAVILTPVVDLGSPQTDLLRAAQQAGLRTAIGVGSWDHLSSKAVIRDAPDRVFVWNDTQRREAIDMHGLAADRVVVTGAQCYDRWFDRQPSRSHAEFCQRAGLPADRPFVLYACSSLFRGSPPEPRATLAWLEALRASASPGLRDVPVLIRPHPARAAEWDGVDVSRFGPVTVWGGYPIDEQSRADYFDALYHAAAVVGLNTSAFIEAGIAGRPVLTFIHPDFWENQTGTLHFKYLVDGGLLDVAHDFDTHLRQLDAALGGDPSRDRRLRFVETFVRPHGLAVSATDRFADAVEAWVAEPAPAPRGVTTHGPARGALTALRAWARTPHGERWLSDARERQKRAARAGGAPPRARARA